MVNSPLSVLSNSGDYKITAINCVCVFMDKVLSISKYSYIICVMGKTSRKKVNLSQVIISAGHPNPPEPHEVEAAYILAHHYQETVEFLIPVDDYKRKSADIVMLGVEWEIKCPHGASKSTIGNQFRFASKQSKNIVLDTRRTKLEYDIIENKVQIEIKKRPAIKRVILIDKLEKVIEIQK